MATFDIPLGTTQTVSSLAGTNTINGNSTAAYGAGGGTLDVTGDANNSTITVNGGILHLGHDANHATITLNNSSLDMSGGRDLNNGTVNYGTGASSFIASPQMATSSTFGNVHFTGVASGDVISTGGTGAITGLSYNGSTHVLSFTQGGVTYGLSVTTTGTPNFNVGTVNGHPVIVDGVVVCFAAGTLIRTPRGAAPVESLQVGDVVVTASGELRPVKWIGHSDFDLRGHPNPRPMFPVRIAAEALGPGRPSQDLYVSAGHSICIDLCGEVLIPAENLVNGATITQVEVEEISYWHVELDSHDILIANNLPAESYFPHGNRAFFEETGVTLDALEEGRAKTHADFCRPVVLDGPVLAFVRQRLLARAKEIGWTSSSETDLHLVADGEVRRALSEGNAAVFLFPASARDVRLVSNTFIPALLGGVDSRPLGVSLTGLVFSDARGQARSVSLDDERLREGLHPEEAKSGVAWRWTKGELILNPEFWEGLSGHLVLMATYNNAAATRRWLAPATPQQESRPRLYAVKSELAAVGKKARASAVGERPVRNG